MGPVMRMMRLRNLLSSLLAFLGWGLNCITLFCLMDKLQFCLRFTEHFSSWQSSTRLWHRCRCRCWCWCWWWCAGIEAELKHAHNIELVEGSAQAPDAQLLHHLKHINVSGHWLDLRQFGRHQHHQQHQQLSSSEREAHIQFFRQRIPAPLAQPKPQEIIVPPGQVRLPVRAHEARRLVPVPSAPGYPAPPPSSFLDFFHRLELLGPAYKWKLFGNLTAQTWPPSPCCN